MLEKSQLNYHPMSGSSLQPVAYTAWAGVLKGKVTFLSTPPECMCLGQASFDGIGSHNIVYWSAKDR